MGIDSHSDGTERDDNVVRFPRDWFGPVEDLVPIGRDAGPVPPNSASAQGFWGEDAGALHQAIELDCSPVRDPDPEPVVEPVTAPVPRVPRPARPLVARLGVLLILLAVGALVLGRVASGPAGRTVLRSVADRPATATVDLAAASQSTGRLTAAIGESLTRIDDRIRVAHRRSVRRHQRLTVRHAARAPRHADWPAVVATPAVAPAPTPTPAPASGSTLASARAGGATVVSAHVATAAPSTTHASTTRTRSTAGSSGAAGPAGLGVAGSNCNPQCR